MKYNWNIDESVLALSDFRISEALLFGNFPFNHAESATVEKNPSQIKDLISLTPDLYQYIFAFLRGFHLFLNFEFSCFCCCSKCV